MTISINISSMFMMPITLIRFSAGSYINGLYVESSSISIPIQASVQPVPSSQYRFLPEGDSPANFRTVYTNELLKIGTHNGSKPDEVLYQGITYRLFSLNDWLENGYASAIFKSTEVN